MYKTAQGMARIQKTRYIREDRNVKKTVFAAAAVLVAVFGARTVPESKAQCALPAAETQAAGQSSLSRIHSTEVFRTEIQPQKAETPKAETPKAEAQTQPRVNRAEFTAYAYCACQKCCGPCAKGITASGTQATQGRTIAVDPDVIPLGTRVSVNGREYVAEDTGSGISGDVIDIFFDSHEEALEWGRRQVTVSWPAE